MSAEYDDHDMDDDDCPNCGGELLARPRRPASKLAANPASTERVYRPAGCASPA